MIFSSHLDRHMTRAATRATAAMIGTILMVGVAKAEQHTYPTLKPADPPCLHLLDETTGQPTGAPVNQPCTQSKAPIKRLDKASPKLQESAHQGKSTGRREKGSGMATGRRQHSTF